jgi:hypothetical protein
MIEIYTRKPTDFAQPIPKARLCGNKTARRRGQSDEFLNAKRRRLSMAHLTSSIEAENRSDNAPPELGRVRPHD